uniref:uncharacterized protein LOC124074328 n=1 Tax=Scatophagus argus TaxID=75038 RepID=UPI001ED8192C|nr:uncharacterized protein LOC124074328 [Scatophagus argus]
MKTCKPSLKTSVEEECGVWLDTAQLKKKAKQKRPSRPISKLLNPFAGGEGYNLAVALNFTQTKVEMPKTKQSSISTFFAPQRRVINRLTTSEEPKMDPVLPSLSSTTTTCASAAPTPVASGTKRKREIDLNLNKSEPRVDHEWKSEHVFEAAEWQEQAASITPSLNVYCGFEEERFEEINPPRSKRRLTATSSVPVDSQPLPQPWSQDPLFTYNQCSEDEHSPDNHKNTTAKHLSDSEPSFINGLQNEEAFGVCVDVEAITSTQKFFKHVHSSQVDDEKENSRILSSTSPRKQSTVSHIESLTNHKWTEQKTASPRKQIPVGLCKKTHKEDSYDSQFKWTKPSKSPLKTQLSCRAVDEDSLAMLFTQDSEGFRVIAHRGLLARSPLKDQSNVSTRRVRISACKFLMEEDEEDEMLFTQDSQGNLVIKH